MKFDFEGMMSKPLESTGRLSKAAQPGLLLDGRQLGPICKLCPLPLPRAAHLGSSRAQEDLARNLFFQVKAGSV